MRLDLSQQMKMDQRMVLAPRMIQSMEILQLPLLALQERIEQEMLSNPMLETEEPEPIDGESSAENSDQTADEVDDAEQVLTIKEDNDKAEDFQRLDNLGNDFDDYLGRSDYAPKRRSGDDTDPKYEAMQNTAAPAQSLNEYLTDQWAFVEAEEILKKIGQVIIDLIEDTGYFRGALEDIQKNIQEKVSADQMAQAQGLVQTLEPTGIGANGLAQCLILQLQSVPKDRRLEIELIGKHLKDIEMNRFPAIARKTGRSMDEITAAIEVISRLDPRPGLQIGRHDTPYILPDIIIDYDEIGDSYHARLTSGALPNIRLNPFYSKLLKQSEMTEKAREFLQNNARSARWLIESIEQRKTTLLRVVKHVIKNQRGFLENGPIHLKPLPMVDVADALGIHVGTVSRAVSGKYVQTPIGIYALRYFFSGGTETSSGQSVSWGAIRAKLQAIIDNEDKANPYSDDELVEQLGKQGLTLARRTIAKYRGLMNVPPARRRRQYH